MADLSAGPPPRWRVVERDRRLVVIDTMTGTPAGSAPSPPTASLLPKQVQFDGSAELTTHRCYDDKAPRTIRLDPGSAATIGRLKLGAVGLAFGVVLLAITNVWLLLPVAIVLANSKPRALLRAAITRWLDRIARQAS